MVYEELAILIGVLVMPWILYWKARSDMRASMEKSIETVMDSAQDLKKEVLDSAEDFKKDAIQIINELKADVAAAPQIIGAQLAKSFSGQLGGLLSGSGRLDKGLASRLFNDFTKSQSPIAQWLIEYGKESIPFLQDHPELIAEVLPHLSKLAPGLGGLLGGGDSKPPERKSNLGL